MGYTEETMAVVEKVIEKAGIERRHTCIASTPEAFVNALLHSGPRARAELWEREAPVLAAAAARDALAHWPSGTAAAITHVVTHSCTGFAAPGLDHHLITALGLRPSTRRVGVNFMGCFGGMTALYVAKQIVEAAPEGAAVVLVVCVETCSLHMSATDTRTELVIGNTIFADGAGAAVVTSAGRAGGVGAAANTPASWGLGDMASEVLPDSAGAMTWRNNCDGTFAMWLDKSIPAVLSRAFATRGLSLLRAVGVLSPWRCAWALHPGGAAIVRAFRRAFDVLRIPGEGLDASLEVLRDHGNMSSASIFFVLQRVLARTAADEVFVAAFGPGLTIEFARLYRLPQDGGGAVKAQGPGSGQWADGGETDAVDAGRAAMPAPDANGCANGHGKSVAIAAAAAALAAGESGARGHASTTNGHA